MCFTLDESLPETTAGGEPEILKSFLKFTTMLVTSMNPAEINNQIYREYDKLWSSTVTRLVHEYHRERKKLKIDKDRLYTKDYHIKTTSKNNWIICIGKAPSIEKYNNPESTTVTCVVYYYTEKGIRVFNPGSKEAVAVFNGHFFKRYNERLHLNLSKPVDIIVHFFKHSRDIHQTLLPKEQKMYSIGFCKNGMLLGEFNYNEKWLVWKTFISRDLTKRNQEEVEYELINSLQTEVETALKNEQYDKQQVRDWQNKIKGILPGNTSL